MACDYCTPRTNPETGESLEFCKGFHHVEYAGVNRTEARIHLVQDEDDGEWSYVVLLADDWLSDYIHKLGEPAKHAGVIVTNIPAPPYCPFCGRRIRDDN